MLAKRTDRDHRQLNTVLRSLIGKLDGVLLIRTLSQKEYRKAKEYIGIPIQRIDLQNVNRIEWNASELKPGRFIHYEPTKSTPEGKNQTLLETLDAFEQTLYEGEVQPEKRVKPKRPELAVCLSKHNPISNTVIILTRKRITTENFHEITEEQFTMTDRVNKKDLLLPWVEYPISKWDPSKIVKGSVFIKKENGRCEVPIVCTEMSQDNKIRYAYYQYDPIEIEAKFKN
jgi:hypothetical protein